MATAVYKVEATSEVCAVCGEGGELLSPEEHDAGAPPLQVPLRTMLLHLNSKKVTPDGRLCPSCIKRAIEAYEFSSALSAKSSPPLGEKIRALRQKLHELTKKIDVFIVVGGPGKNSGGSYNEDDIIMVDSDALEVAVATDEDDLGKVRNARGDTVYQCTVCPMTYLHQNEYRSHLSTHPANSRHSCWTCGAQFAAREALRDHSLQHDPPKDLTCYLCDTTFRNVSQLRTHASKCPRSTYCPSCGKSCGTKAALKDHVRSNHRLVCNMCFRRMPSRVELATHALAHRQADRFVCGYDACILRFANRNDLLAHIRKKHSDEAGAGTVAKGSSRKSAAQEETPCPSVPCPQCPRTFGSAAAMKRHIRVHRRDRTIWQEQTEVDVDESLNFDVEYLEIDDLDSPTGLDEPFA